MKDAGVVQLRMISAIAEEDGNDEFGSVMLQTYHTKFM